jgi:hypothetical protein
MIRQKKSKGKKEIRNKQQKLTYKETINEMKPAREEERKKDTNNK